MNLLNEKYVFQKRKRILRNPLWTAGSITEKHRGSLASLPPEGVSASNGRWIKDGWIGLDEERERRPARRERRPKRRRPSPAAIELTGAHGMGEPVHKNTRDRYGSKENHEANSPRATSRVEANRGWRAARGGGRRQSAKFGDVSRASQSMKKK